MKLPFRKSAYIPEEKLTEYILSETHTVGRLKAKFFRKAGFDGSNASVLRDALLEIAYSQEVREVGTSAYGKKYVIDGKLIAPNGNSLNVTTIWIIEINQKSPRFITVYPD